MDPEYRALDHGGEVRRANFEMLYVFYVGLNADRAEELSDGCVSLTGAVENLNLGFRADVDCFPVALELHTCVCAGSDNRIVGNNLAGR